MLFDAMQLLGTCRKIAGCAHEGNDKPHVRNDACWNWKPISRKNVFPDSIGFSMSPFGYVFTMERGLDGAYGCRGKDGCNGKWWPHEDESLEDFKLRMRAHADAKH